MSADRAGRQHRRGLDLIDRSILKPDYAADRGLEPGGEQRVCLHAIAVERNDAGEAAEAHRRGHRERREKRNHP